jgi:cytoskeletal protein CcmA (bactofilin family)
MARKNHDDALGVTGAETVIGAGVTVRGELDSQADMHIDGMLNGTIKTEGDITFGPNARIKANTTAHHVIVAGHVSGDITADGDVTIRETGQVIGDIRAASLAIIPGGVFVGRNHMQTPGGIEPEIDPTPAVESKPSKQV